MDKLAKRIGIVSVVTAVPIGLWMAGMLVFILATEGYGITSKWKASEILYMVCGAVYPALAILSVRKVARQDSQKMALAWSLVPVPILLYLVVTTIGAFNNW